MPNHIENIITLKGDEQKIREMLEAIQNDDYGIGSVDFNKIVPMPKSLDIEAGSCTDRGLKLYKEFISEYLFDKNNPNILKNPRKALEEAEKDYLRTRKDIKSDEWELGKNAWDNIQKYGVPTWYEWTVNNWGTKWNSYDYDVESNYERQNGLFFQTAWSAPHPIIKKLSEMYPDVFFEHEWADEDIGANCGRKCYEGGEQTEEYYPDNLKDGIEFACRVWNYDPAELNLVLNKAENDYINTEVEEFDLVEIFDKPMLFTNERLSDADIPKGLFCYHLREGDDGSFAAIEPKVMVNHGGSVITDEPIYFKNQGYIAFDRFTEPNFLSEYLTFGEYMRSEFEESEDESQQFGGMQM